MHRFFLIILLYCVHFPYKYHQNISGNFLFFQHFSEDFGSQKNAINGSVSPFKLD
eukprot:UN00902